MVITAEDKLKEIMRELKLRQRLYPSWIATGKLDERDARRQIAVLMEIASDYVKQTQSERPELTAAVIEWRDARAAFLQYAGDVAHTDDDYIPQDVCRRFTDAEAKLFEVARKMCASSPAEPHTVFLDRK